MRKPPDSTKQTCSVLFWLKRGSCHDDYADDIESTGIDDDDDDFAYCEPQIFSEEGEKTENQSDGGVYQLRSTS